MGKDFCSLVITDLENWNYVTNKQKIVCFLKFMPFYIIFIDGICAEYSDPTQNWHDECLCSRVWLTLTNSWTSFITWVFVIFIALPWNLTCCILEEVRRFPFKQLRCFVLCVYCVMNMHIDSWIHHTSVVDICSVYQSAALHKTTMWMIEFVGFELSDHSFGTENFWQI